ncbi:sulfatase-like hydrolase/transferase [Candidatus Sumerlaeota bacterium]|nr:sulfatase-like hydrolase/transferase [Candidatus Sumerlaeota bacterium]
MDKGTTVDADTGLWYALTYHSQLTHSEVHALVEQWRGEKDRPFADLFNASLDDLKWAGLTDRQWEGIERARREMPAARAELDPCTVAGIEAVSCVDALYPARLASSLGASRPPLLFCSGNLRLLTKASVAVIGSRKPSEPAVRFTAETATRLATEGVTVVSGFAEGVDRYASMAALEAGGTTILVLAQGILTFAREGEELAPWLKQGRILVVSAFRPRSEWQTPLAMARNAMITGMASDVVVSHSRSVGGAWEAARMALRQGKCVWVRGDLNPNLGHGALSSLGARLVDWPSDEFDAWAQSIAQHAHGEHAGRTASVRWTESSVLELLRTGSPADIHEACGITGSLLQRIVEGRETVSLKRLEDLMEIKGLGEAAVQEVRAAFEFKTETRDASQLSLFPEIEEYPGWDGRILRETPSAPARKPRPVEPVPPSEIAETETIPLADESPAAKKTRKSKRAQPVPAPTPKPPKTNLLVLMASGLRADFLGCYGAAAPATPYIDRLASRGAVLTRAYTTHTHDAPARATFLTGMSARGHGLWRNGVKLDESVRTLASHLASQGYRTACVGKMHLGPYEAPFETRSKESRAYWDKGLMDRWTGAYYGFNQARLVLGHGANALAAGHYAQWLHNWHSTDVAKLSPENARIGKTQWPEAYTVDCRPQVHATPWIADHTAAFLKEYGEDPFFVFCSFPDPHPPYAALPEYLDRVVAEDLAPAISAPASRNGLPAGFGEAAQHAAPRDEQVEEIRLHYAAMVAQIDEAVGFVLDKLEEMDLFGRTLVVLTSDHGDVLGDHGLVGAGPYHFAPLIRVPSVWSLPGTIPAGAKIDGLFSHLDFVPTASRLIRSLVPLEAQGRALDGLLRAEKKAPTRDSALVEWESVSTAPRMSLKTIVTPDKRMTYYVGEPSGEFYDLSRDPEEHENRFAKMSPTERAGMMQSLLDLLSETDTRTPIATGKE